LVPAILSWSENWKKPVNITEELEVVERDVDRIAHWTTVNASRCM